MLHRVATKGREEIKRATKQKMAWRYNKEGGNHLDQESNRPTMFIVVRRWTIYAPPRRQASSDFEGMHVCIL